MNSILYIKKTKTLYIFLLVFLTLICLTFCVQKESIQEIRGHILYLESNSLQNVSEIQIKGSNDEITILKPQIYKGFLPSHIRHHQIINEPLTIRYVINDGILTIISMND